MVWKWPGLPYSSTSTPRSGTTVTPTAFLALRQRAAMVYLGRTCCWLLYVLVAVALLCIPVLLTAV